MNLWNNLRFAARQLRKSPGFTVAVLATLGLCIGANTAIFTVVDSVFFRPLPYPQPDRLVMVEDVVTRGGASHTGDGQDGAEWELIRDHASFLDAAVFNGGTEGVNLVASGHVDFIRQQRVSAGFFHVLGVKPLLGRGFQPQEDHDGGPQLTVLSYGLWQRLFPKADSPVGRTVDVRGAPYTVIGVMPPGFQTEEPVDLWTPIHASHEGEGEGTNFEIIGRLKPGVTLTQASGQLTAVTRPVVEARHLPPGITLEEHAIPLQEGLGSDLRSKISLLWAAVGLVLLIGCVNIAGLLLSRSAIRSREIATRMAIGAGRARIVSQLLAESLLLALSGGLLGLLVGKLALAGLLKLNPDEFGMWSTVHLDLRLMLIMMAVSLGTSIVFGLFPAWDATSVDLRSALADATRSSTGGRNKWRRQALVFCEVTLAVLLVVSASLLVRTFTKLAGMKPGFNAQHTITATLSLQDARYANASAGLQLFRSSLDRIRQIPGVESAAVALSLPYQRPLNMGVQAVTGEDVSHTQQITNFTYVTPEFFKVLQIPLLRGRLLSEADTATSAKVAVVNEAFLRLYFRHNPQPLGSQIQIGNGKYLVVGVVGDTVEKNGWGGKWGPIDRFGQVFVSAEQFPPGMFALVHTWFSPNWIVRTHGTVPGIREAMRHALQAVDPRLPFSAFHDMSEFRGASLAEQRYQAILFSSLAGLAILLAALGVYGLIAQSVAERTREMGIRLALGANVKNIIQAASQTGIVVSLAAVATGLILALFATRVLKSLVWGVSASDPASLFAVAALLTSIAIASSVIPALRLLRLDPAQTLRDQ